MNKIKVLLITARADLGGGPKSMNTIACNISGKFDIYICSPKDEPYYSLYKENKRIKGIFEIPHRKFSIIKFFGLFFFVKKNKIQIVNSNGNGAGLYARLLKLLNPKLKVIHTFRGINIKGEKTLRRRFYFFYERCFTFLTTKFINVSHGEQEVSHLHKITNNCNSVVIYNGIHALKMQEISDELIKFKDKFIICSLSRFDYQKNMMLSYEIAKKLKLYKDILFIWIGDGDDKNYIERKVKEDGIKNVILTGFKENISEYLSISDVYLSTARWEGLPLALLEAASLKIPIVASNVTGNNEVVNDSCNSFIFDLNNSDEAVEKILRLYHDKDLYRDFSEAIYRTFHTKFEKSIMVKSTENLFLRIMKQG